MKTFPGFVRGRLTTEKRDGEDGPSIVAGYGAVFYNADDPGTEYWLWDDVVERIKPGAFDRALQEADDVRSFFNHDANLILGRASAGTLDLAVDGTGLRYVVEPPDTAVARHVLESVERGDTSGSSFMFVPTSTAWREEEREGKTVYIREIESVRLFEVGPVVFPAYESASSEARSSIAADPACGRFDAWLSRHTSNARSEFDVWRFNSPEARQARCERFEKRVTAIGTNCGHNGATNP